jgi:hypothetical protein
MTQEQQQKPGTPPPPAKRDKAAEKAARAPLPPENEGSGHFAVYDETVGQYVSGVGDEKTAAAAKTELEAHNGLATEGHTLTVREV